ncbi:MAG: NUDIX domain-containing protein [Gammaproteobacteria bacterium]|nr:NUDIX domain-containing protein [Gammaproteobacteria bacterium]NNM01248.1 NUDIX domain-containing protein [Gammaproteobacteria bacterium]
MTSAARGKPPEARFALNVVENAGGELLLLKRSPDARLGPGLWGFPAGHIEAGETPAACAARELGEEIGPDHSVSLRRALPGLRDSLYGGRFEIFLFHLDWQAGSIRLNHEHTEYAWVARDAYQSYDVMDGIDEDIFLLGIWPRQYLNTARLDEALALRRAAGA